MRKNVSGRNGTAQGSSLRAPRRPRCASSAARTSLAIIAPTTRAAIAVRRVMVATAATTGTGEAPLGKLQGLLRPVYVPYDGV